MDGERACRFFCTLVACPEACVGVIEVPSPIEETPIETQFIL